MSGCNACPRRCGVDRTTAVGACGVGAAFRVARMALHAWEEPCISGKSGSGAIFFSGCPLKCVFCQNTEISRGCKGVDLTEDQLIAGMQRLIDSGAQNINLVSPTQYAPALARLLRRWKPPVPVVYNTGGYERLETLRQLEGLIDIYLPDFSTLARLRRRLTALRRTMWSGWARRCWKCAARCRTGGTGIKCCPV